MYTGVVWGLEGDNQRQERKLEVMSKGPKWQEVAKDTPILA